jgi:FkbM family methyltransferase
MTPRVLIKKILFRVRYYLWRFVRNFYRGGRLYSFRVGRGLYFDYPLDSAIGSHLFAGGFEPAELAFFGAQLKPGQIVLDVGANAGLYTLIAAQVVGERGHVYAFEPGRDALALLRHNVKINGLSNVTIIESAVSNETGEASFGVATDSAMSSLAATDRSDQQIAAWTTVSTIRIDDAIAKYQIPRVDFIKVDVEGAERLVFEGAGNLLARNESPVTILFEAFAQNCSAFGYTVEQILADLRQVGFQLRCFDRSDLVPVEQVRSGIGSAIYNFVAVRS